MISSVIFGRRNCGATLLSLSLPPSLSVSYFLTLPFFVAKGTYYSCNTCLVLDKRRICLFPVRFGSTGADASLVRKAIRNLGGALKMWAISWLLSYLATYVKLIFYLKDWNIWKPRTIANCFATEKNRPRGCQQFLFTFNPHFSHVCDYIVILLVCLLDHSPKQKQQGEQVKQPILTAGWLDDKPLFTRGKIVCKPRMQTTNWQNSWGAPCMRQCHRTLWQALSTRRGINSFPTPTLLFAFSYYTKETNGRSTRVTVVSFEICWNATNCVCGGVVVMLNKRWNQKFLCRQVPVCVGFTREGKVKCDTPLMAAFCYHLHESEWTNGQSICTGRHMASGCNRCFFEFHTCCTGTVCLLDGFDPIHTSKKYIFL